VRLEAMGIMLGVNPDTLRYRMKKLGIPFRKKRKTTSGKAPENLGENEK
jgi:hypothetical protein